MQGAQAAVDEEAVERAGHRADGVLDEAHALVEGLVGHDHRTTDDVRMTSQVLGCRVDHGIGSEFERPLNDRGREGVVDGDDGRPFEGDHAGEVHHIQEWVRGSLDPDQPGLGADRAFESL